MREHEELQAVAEFFDIEWCSHYGEPGYSDPEKGVMFANWNNIPKELAESFETEGYSIEWSDEWVISYETNKAYRTSPDCYSWTPYFVMTDDGEIVGGDEIESGDQAEWYINEYLLNDATKCNVFRIDLASHGFKQAFADLETGFHPGQNDSPPMLLKRAQEDYSDHDVVFALDGKGQFDCRWSVWVRPIASD